jgi:putative sigma-54 modulation protein
MNVAVHSVHFKASNRLLEYVQSKVETVTQVSNRVNKATVFLRLDNNHLHENKIAEVCIHLPGREVVVKKEAKTMETLRRIVKRNKGKHLSFKKR